MCLSLSIRAFLCLRTYPRHFLGHHGPPRQSFDPREPHRTAEAGAAQEALPLHGDRTRHRGRLSPLRRAGPMGAARRRRSRRYWTDTIGLADDHEPADGSAVCATGRRRTKPASLSAARMPEATARPPWRMRSTPTSAIWRRAAAGRQCGRSPQADPLHAAGPAGRAPDLPRAAALARRPARRPQGVVGQPHCKSLKAALNLAAATIRASATRRCGATRWRAAGRAHRSPCRTARARRAQNRRRRLCGAPWLGLWAEVAATTGARPSQIARLDVADLQDGARPAADDAEFEEGPGRKRIERRPVPIPPTWQPSCGAAAGKTPAGGSAADPGRRRALAARRPRQPFARAAAQAGLAGVTAMRCATAASSARLLAGVPIRVVAAQHDTSVTMIERNYSAYILDHSDAVSRPRCSIWRCSHEPAALPALPLESPDWIPHATALQAAIKQSDPRRWRSRSSTTPSRPGTIRCKIESLAMAQTASW